MKAKKKKPELVVWDDEKGYYARELTYGSNIGAPAIKKDDIATWKQIKVTEVNNQFRTKYNELKAEAEKLIDEYNWNDLIYRQAQYSFQPSIGEIYHLYIRKDDTMFLSLVSPEEWSQQHISSFRLDSNNKWIKS